MLRELRSLCIVSSYKPVEKMSFQPASENRKRRGGSDVLGSLFQAETAVTMKARPPIEEHLVAGILVYWNMIVTSLKVIRSGTRRQ